MKIILIAEGKTDFPKSIVSPEEDALSSLAEANEKRVALLAAGLAKLGCEVLLVQAKPSENPSGAFELAEGKEFNRLFVETGKSKLGVRLPLKEYFDFSAVLSEKAPEFIKLFRPEVVIYSALFPFCVSAAEKLASLSGAALVTELPCSSSRITEKVKFPFFDTLLAPVLKKGMRAALEKSDLLVSYYPAAKKDLSDDAKLWESFFPLEEPPETFSEAAKSLHSELCEIREKGSFVLAFGVKILSKGQKPEELIHAFSSFEEKYLLVLIGGGSYKTVLKRQARESRAKNVLFFDGLPEKELPFVFSAANAVFVSENKLSAGAMPRSAEVFYALLSGKPVFALEEDFSGFGSITRLSQPSEICRKLDSLSHRSTEEAASAEKKQRLFAEKCLSQNYVKEYYDRIKDLSKKEK